MIVNAINSVYMKVGQMRNISLLPIFNISTFIQAKFGNEQAIIEMAIKYINDGDISSMNKYDAIIDKNNLAAKYPESYEYYQYCISHYFKHQYPALHLEPTESDYHIKWNVIKRAINDNLITISELNYVLSMTIVSENDETDYIEYIFKNVKDKVLLLSILSQRPKLLKKSLMFGFNKGFLKLTDIYDISLQNSNIATAMVALFNNARFVKSINQKQLLKWAFELGIRFAPLRYDCGLVCLSLSNLEKSGILLSNVEKSSANYAKAMKEYGDILYTNSSDPLLASDYYRKAYKAGDVDAKLLLAASEMKATGKTPSIVDLYHKTVEQNKTNNELVNISGKSIPAKTALSLFSKRLSHIHTISQESFSQAYKDYLSNRGFFSYQSIETKKAIEKASKSYITDQKRFQILKKYVDKKSNFGRGFWSSIVGYFGQRFIDANNNLDVKHENIEGSLVRTKTA